MVVSCHIRTFLNTDIPSLVRIWREHHLAAGIQRSCPSNVWEYCILNKPFFDQDSFFVACLEGEPFGFLHATLGSNIDGSDVGHSWGLVNAVCMPAHPDEAIVAASLMQRAQEFFHRQRCSEVIATASPKHYAFYLGIAQGDGLLGVPAEDIRLRHWLSQAGYSASSPNEMWELDLSNFRQPMDRNQIQIRRQCQVSRLLDGYACSWWQATAMGHAEEIRFQLQARQPPIESYEVSFWQPDITIHGLDTQATYLWPFEFPTTSLGVDRVSFLLAESLRQLKQERVSLIRTVVSMNATEAIQVLQKLGFQSKASGLTFRAP